MGKHRPHRERCSIPLTAPRSFGGVEGRAAQRPSRLLSARTAERGHQNRLQAQAEQAINALTRTTQETRREVCSAF